MVTTISFCIATSQLNQRAMDFTGNKKQIKESILSAYRQEALYRVGPELEICGLDIGDHLYEPEFINTCWNTVKEIITVPFAKALVIDLGVPVKHGDMFYNCRAICFDGIVHRIVSIGQTVSPPHRAIGHHAYFSQLQEPFFFSPFPDHPKVLVSSEPFTICIENSLVKIAIQSNSNDVQFYQDFKNKADILINTHSTPFELQALKTRIRTLCQTICDHNVYIIANSLGCDSGKSYYAGGSGIFYKDGCVLAPPHSLSPVCTVVMSCQIPDVPDTTDNNSSTNSHTSNASSNDVLFKFKQLPRMMTREFQFKERLITSTEEITEWPEEKEIGYAASTWLFDYLRKSRACGYLLPLSGGADSASVLALTYMMFSRAIETGQSLPIFNEILYLMFPTLSSNSDKMNNLKELMTKTIYTVYMGSQNSSKQTEQLASSLAKEAGSKHLVFYIHKIFDAFLKLLSNVFSKPEPKFEAHGGTINEDLALQNLQARIRMISAYLLAALIPWFISPKARVGLGPCLVLGTGNNDESVTGYFTKYDCSSADINPIGSLSKIQIRAFLNWFSKEYGLPSFHSVTVTASTAELRPLQNVQTDETDMGLTYQEIEHFNYLRRVKCFGPLSMIEYLCKQTAKYATDIGLQKVTRFYTLFCKNRHKMSVATPALHLTPTDCDPHIYDKRPVTYPESIPYKDELQRLYQNKA